MRFLILSLTFFAMSLAQGDNKMKMYFNNEEVTKIVEFYSKSSGQKFIIDPSVRGKVSIFLQNPVSTEEAFEHLSSALAINGFAISKQGDTMVIKTARNIQRDLIEVSTNQPSLKPERMYTWIYNVKNMPAEFINRDLRILPSRDGEVNVSTSTNQLIFTDWTSNLNRIAALMKEIDKPVDPSTAKLIETSKKDLESRRKNTNKKE